jgi:hypothetical protein
MFEVLFFILNVRLPFLSKSLLDDDSGAFVKSRDEPFREGPIK